MSEPFDDHRKLILLGYIPIVSEGFALPIFAQSPNPNVWFCARTATGDRASIIVSFDEFHDHSSVILLDESKWIEVAIGDPWFDVFLWNGEIFVSGAEELLLLLKDSLPIIRATAPLTYLDLMSHDIARDSVPDFKAAFDFLSTRYGLPLAREIAVQCLMRREFIKVLRRIAVNDEWPSKVRDSISTLVLKQVGDRIHLEFEHMLYLQGSWTDTSPIDELEAKISQWFPGVEKQVGFLMGGVHQTGGLLDASAVRTSIGESRSLAIHFVVIGSEPDGILLAAEDIAWLPRIDQQADVPFNHVPVVTASASKTTDFNAEKCDVLVVLSMDASVDSINREIALVDSHLSKLSNDAPLVLVAPLEAFPDPTTDEKWHASMSFLATSNCDALIDTRPVFSNMYPELQSNTYGLLYRYLVDISIVAAVDYRLLEHIQFARSQNQMPVLTMGLSGAGKLVDFEKITGVGLSRNNYLSSLNYETLFFSPRLREGIEFPTSGTLWMHPLAPTS